MTNSSGLNPDENKGGGTDNSGEGSTDTENKGNNSTDGNNRNDLTINRQTGNRNGKSLRSNPTVDISNKASKGAEPDIEYVLGLRFEKVVKKVSYDVFCKKFANYIGRNMKYRNKLVCAMKDYKDKITYVE